MLSIQIPSLLCLIKVPVQKDIVILVQELVTKEIEKTGNYHVVQGKEMVDTDQGLVSYLTGTYPENVSFKVAINQQVIDDVTDKVISWIVATILCPNCTPPQPMLLKSGRFLFVNYQKGASGATSESWRCGCHHVSVLKNPRIW